MPDGSKRLCQHFMLKEFSRQVEVTGDCCESGSCLIQSEHLSPLNSAAHHEKLIQQRKLDDLIIAQSRNIQAIIMV